MFHYQGFQFTSGPELIQHLRITETQDSAIKPHFHFQTYLPQTVFLVCEPSPVRIVSMTSNWEDKDDLLFEKAATTQPNKQKLSKNELERVTEVFKMYETGEGEATIYPRDLAIAMKKLGLNPTETEIQDLINAVEVNGLIYYQDFCRIIVRKFREDDEENFHQELFRTLVGPKEYPSGTQAPIYDVNKELLSFTQFKAIMTNLPEMVNDNDVARMFMVADKDSSGKISYQEFRRMCVVPRVESIPDEMPDIDVNGEIIVRHHSPKVDTVVSVVGSK